MDTKRLLTLGGFAALYLILAQLGVAFIYVFGLPAGTGGFINLIWSATIPVIAVLVVRKFWAATIMLTIYYTLALPLPIGGTPGFFPKILLGIVGGLPMDVVYYFFRKQQQIAAALMAVATNLTLGIGVVILGRAFGLPGVDKLEAMLLNPKIMAVVVLIAALLGLAALAIYRKIEKTAVVRRIQRG